MLINLNLFECSCWFIQVLWWLYHCWQTNMELNWNFDDCEVKNKVLYRFCGFFFFLKKLVKKIFTFFYIHTISVLLFFLLVFFFIFSIQTIFNNKKFEFQRGKEEGAWARFAMVVVAAAAEKLKASVKTHLC